MLPSNFPGLPAGWKTEIETFRSADGAETLCWQKHTAPGAKKKRALLVLHGMGEHGGRYLHFTHYLKDEFDAIFCLDHRGHGRSGGIRGHVARFDSMADDVALAIKRIAESFSEIHLVAHSMGGQVALRALFLHPELPLASVSVSAPLMAIKVKVPAPKKIAAKVLNKIWGSLQLPTGVNADVLSHDPEVALCYRQDRLVHDKMTPAFFNGLEAAMADSLSRKKGILPPIQFLVPLKDELVDPQTTIRFYESLEHPAKRLKTYPDFFHESMNEVGKERFFDDVREWVIEHPARST